MRGVQLQGYKLLAFTASASAGHLLCQLAQLANKEHVEYT